MQRLYNLYSCEVCGHSRQRPGMCPFCKIELMGEDDTREIALETASRVQKKQLEQYQWYA